MIYKLSEKVGVESQNKGVNRTYSSYSAFNCNKLLFYCQSLS